MTRLARTLLLVLSPILLGLTTACSPDAVPTATPPVGGASFSVNGSAADLDPVARFSGRPAWAGARAQQWIGPDGGRLELAGFAVEVPAGAVERRTKFSIRLPADPRGAERVVADFGPHGRGFAVPVYIELPYAGTTLEGGAAEVVWWNPRTRVWEEVGGSLTADGQRLRVATPHFSTYGTRAPRGARRGGGVTASGG